MILYAIYNRQHTRPYQIMTTNWQYREFMTKNAQLIRENNRIVAFNQPMLSTASNAASILSSSISSSITNPQQKDKFTYPYTFKGIHDQSRPPEYEDSDLKHRFLAKQQMNCRMVAPTIKKPSFSK